jgi:hypothetical protein
MEGNQAISLIHLTFSSLAQFEYPFLGARLSKHKSNDNSSIKDDYKHKKGKARSTVPLNAKVIDLDAPTSTTTATVTATVSNLL